LHLQGCDASVMLMAPNGDDESHSGADATLSPDAVDAINKAKAAVEALPGCAGKVSCADILAMAARDVVSLVCMVTFIPALSLSLSCCSTKPAILPVSPRHVHVGHAGVSVSGQARTGPRSVQVHHPPSPCFVLAYSMLFVSHPDPPRRSVTLMAGGSRGTGTVPSLRASDFFFPRRLQPQRTRGPVARGRAGPCTARRTTAALHGTTRIRPEGHVLRVSRRWPARPRTPRVAKGRKAPAPRAAVFLRGGAACCRCRALHGAVASMRGHRPGLWAWPLLSRRRATAWLARFGQRQTSSGRELLRH
jgi:hypothetical protein